MSTSSSRSTSSSAGLSSHTTPIGSSSSRPDRKSPNQRPSFPRQRPQPLPLSSQTSPSSKIKDKSILQSYRSLSPNARIVFGLVVGAVGIAGLMWDRQVAQDDVSPSNTFNITTVEREPK